MEYKQDEEDDEDDDERIDYPERNDVPAPLPLVRQNVGILGGFIWLSIQAEQFTSCFVVHSTDHVLDRATHE